MKQKKEDASDTTASRRGFGITGKLASAIVISVVIAVAVLLAVVYFQMSHALLERVRIYCKLLQTEQFRKPKLG